jgi:dTDP-4-amino-4,6-dideoxygalactose transaminase
MGLVNLKYVQQIIDYRKQLSAHYDSFLKNFQAKKPVISHQVKYNYAYYPLFFNEESLLKKVVDVLSQNWIYPRRYFFPSLEDLPYVTRSEHCPVADSISKRSLCIPLYDTLTKEEIDMICRLMLRVQNN